MPGSDLSEHQHQVMVCEWMDLEGILYFAVPNSGKRSMATASYMKAEGLKKGVPDLVIPEPRKPYHGLYVEMKKPRSGRLSDEQRDWLRALSENGYATAVCYGFNDAQKAIGSYMRGDFDA